MSYTPITFRRAPAAGHAELDAHAQLRPPEHAPHEPVSTRLARACRGPRPPAGDLRRDAVGVGQYRRGGYLVGRLSAHRGEGLPLSASTVTARVMVAAQAAPRLRGPPQKAGLPLIETIRPLRTDISCAAAVR